MKTVHIEFWCNDNYPIFTLSFVTVEHVDLVRFVQNDFKDGTHSAWLMGIKQAIDSIKSGYHNSDNFKCIVRKE